MISHCSLFHAQECQNMHHLYLGAPALSSCAGVLGCSEKHQYTLFFIQHSCTMFLEEEGRMTKTCYIRMFNEVYCVKQHIMFNKLKMLPSDSK
jgi:hypothetical protein